MLDKLFDHIDFQLKEETDKYKRLKICKYNFELSKVCISVGLSFISIFAILTVILIPIIDADKNNSDVDK